MKRFFKNYEEMLLNASIVTIDALQSPEANCAF